MNDYVIPCHSCGMQFNSMESAWCSCVTKHRTFVCPSCLDCFCKAPHSFVRGFWANAPRELLRRRREERGGQADPREVPELRPLVLVVDDDPDVRSLAVGAIAALGYGVIAAGSADAAFVLAEKHRPDLVLSDALMPRVDGRELCQRIKKDPVLASTPVVIMTAVYKAGRYQTEAKKTFGADALVSKPLQVSQLGMILQGILPSMPVVA